MELQCLTLELLTKAKKDGAKFYAVAGGLSLTLTPSQVTKAFKDEPIKTNVTCRVKEHNGVIQYINFTR